MLLGDINLVHIYSFYEPPVTLRQLDVIPAHLPLPHPPILSERPILKSVTALPLHTVFHILVLVPELDRDLICSECEKLFPQTIVLLLLPLLCQKVYDLIVALDEAGSISPDAVFGICLRNGDWVSGWALANNVQHWNKMHYVVFQRSWAFFTLIRATSSVKGGASDIFAWGLMLQLLEEVRLLCSKSIRACRFLQGYLSDYWPKHA
jgi:hypothetical protein